MRVEFPAGNFGNSFELMPIAFKLIRIASELKHIANATEHTYDF